MDSESSIGRALPYSSVVAEQRLRNERYVTQYGELRKPFQPNGIARFDAQGARRPSISNQNPTASFAEILAATGERFLNRGSDILAGLRPIGERSSKLPIGRNRTPSYLEQGVASWNQDMGNLDTVPYSGLITSAAKSHGISPELVAAVVKAESGFNPSAQSRAGAKGLMQLMDSTARSLGVSNVLDPGQNIDGGVKFLSSLLRKYNGDAKLALAAYNAGPGAVEKYGGIPPYKETRDYVTRVLDYWRQFASNAAANDQASIG